MCHTLMRFFSPPGREQEKKSLPVEASAPAFIQPSATPVPILFLPSPSAHSPSLGQSYNLVPVQASDPPIAATTTSSTTSGVREGMDGGKGAVFSRQSGLLSSLCKGVVMVVAVEEVVVVRGNLLSLAPEQHKQQQLVQRKRRERERKTEGGGVDGEDREETGCRGTQYGLRDVCQAFFLCTPMCNHAENVPEAHSCSITNF